MRKITITEQDFNSAMTTWSQSGGSISTIDTNYALKGDLTLHVSQQECKAANLRTLLQVKKDDLIKRKTLYLQFQNEEGIAKILILQSLSEIDDMIFIIDSIIQCQ